MAREAGVSTATVSFVLAGKEPVAAATRERVLEVVNRLGYRRNRHARALRRGAAPTVSVVVPDLTNPYYSEMIAAIEDAAVDAGWMVTLANYQLGQGRETAYLEKVFDDLPDGILYFPTNPAAIETVAGRFAAGPPFVFVDGATANLGNGAVAADNAEGARLAARHFHETGRRRVLFSGPPHGHPSSIARAPAFAQEADRLGLDIADRAWGEHRTADTLDSVLRQLHADPGIDAFFAGNDLLAIQVYSHLHRSGVDVPADVAICGYDGVQIATEVFSPRFTTIRQPIVEMGRRAFDLVTNPPDEFRSITLPVELVVGETT